MDEMRSPLHPGLGPDPASPAREPDPAPTHSEDRRWRSLLHVQDEAALARLVAEIGHESLEYPAVAVALRNELGLLEVQASVGYSPKQNRMLKRTVLGPEDLEALRDTARLAGSVGITVGSHVLWGLGPLLFLLMHDADGGNTGLILLGNVSRKRLPGQSERVMLEMFAQTVSVALLSLQQRRAEEERVRTIETQKRQVEALLQASATIHGLDLDEVLQRIAASMTTDGGFQRAAVYLRDQDDMLHARAFVGVPAEDVERIRVPVPFSVFGHMMRPEMQISRSFLFDHRKHQLPPELLESLSVPEDRSCGPDEWHPLDSLTIPLQDRSGRTIGLVSIDEPSDGRYPDVEKIQVLELFAGACAVAVDQARLYDEVQHLAMTDPLTRLHNRRALEDALRRELERSRRSGSACSVLYCDLDGLKQLNDTFGHETGDRVLQAVAQLLRARFRNSDLAARVGGDEFVLLLPDTPPQQGALVAEELRELISRLGPPAIPAGIQLSVSVGVSGTASGELLSPDELLRAADTALYTAKEAGRNRVRVA